MEVLMNPSIWIGLFTLIILEIVLGIDNIVFIAILTDKLLPKKRDQAQIIGLTLAFIMRLGLLSLISWLVTLTKPIFAVSSFSFSARELILLLGGIFLLFKATTELHERLENKEQSASDKRGYSSFWTVVVQIVILDAIFSLDAIITAVGMVNDLFIMIIAITIAMFIMLSASRKLTQFVNHHQTVIVLCLSFLLMIGFSLIAEGFGFHIPKGYLYVAIGFSILIELFNQMARRNFIKNQSIKPIRERTAEAIMRLMGGSKRDTYNKNNNEKLEMYEPNHFAEEERHMITGVLSLASRTLRSIMTPRNEITWLDCQLPADELRNIIMETPHNMFPVCNGALDQLIGIVRAKDLIAAIANGEEIKVFANSYPAIVVPETLDVLKLLEELRRAKGSIVIVSDEFGIIQGLVTPLDVLEAIAGEFPDEDETPEIEVYKDLWLAKGRTDIHTLQQTLHTPALARGLHNVASLAGLILSQCDQMPVEGEVLIIDEWRFTIRQMVEYRIEQVWIERLVSQKDTKDIKQVNSENIKL